MIFKELSEAKKSKAESAKKKIERFGGIINKFDIIERRKNGEIWKHSTDVDINFGRCKIYSHIDDYFDENIFSIKVEEFKDITGDYRESRDIGELQFNLDMYVKRSIVDIDKALKAYEYLKTLQIEDIITKVENV
jgi:hypothetical protein